MIAATNRTDHERLTMVEQLLAWYREHVYDPGAARTAVKLIREVTEQ